MLNNSQINPFVIGKYVSEEYFCDREKETDLLKKQLFNGRNVTLISDRRIGKSGLISHFFAQQDIKDQFYTISIDLYSTGSLAELVCLFSDRVYRFSAMDLTAEERHSIHGNDEHIRLEVIARAVEFFMRVMKRL